MASSRHLRRLLGAVSTLLVTGFLVIGFSGTAHAADGYRYWNYFHLTDTTWEFSDVGSSDYDPADGTLEGYRFGATGPTDSDGIPPRADLAEVNFETVCGDVEAADGEKRVAVVVDYGTEADADGGTPPAPRADCAVVPADADGLQVLQAVADLRIEKSLTCAIDGYPAKGCGEPVADVKEAGDEQPVAFQLPSADTETGDASGDAADPAASQEDGDSDLLWPLVGVAVVVLAIAGGGLALSRRNKNA